MHNRRSFIKTAAAGGVAVLSGGVRADEAARGRVSADGKGLAGVVVTDGCACVETAPDGSWSLPARDGMRFICVTVPSGWRTERHYRRFEGTAASYDFELLPWPASRPGRFSFLHIGDSEILCGNPARGEAALALEKEWVERARKFADERNCAFFVHTGDICAAKGLEAHHRILNFDTVGRPVFYVVGNHDIISKEHGEATFEKHYGPCWYSFDAGGVHFVVTPMMWGDGKPSYKVDEIEAWLRNDLAIASRKTQPVMLLTHGIYDTNIYDMRHLYDRTKIVTMGSRPLDVMAACDFRAIIHGHLHKNYFRRTDDLRVEVVSVAPPMKDFSTLQVVGVDADRRLHVENRYGHGKPWPGSSTPPPGGWLAQVQGNVFYGAPCVAAGRVFVGTIDPEGKGRAGAYALDAATGRRLWSFKTRSDVLTRVLFAAGSVLVQDTEWFFYALDPETGRERWRFDARDLVGVTGAYFGGGADPLVRSAMTYDDASGRLYAGTKGRALFALDPATGKVVWRTNDPTIHHLSTPAAAVAGEGVVVGSLFWGGLFGYDAKTGKQLWSHTRNNSSVTRDWYASGLPWIERYGFPMFHGGKLYLTSADEFLELEPRTGEPIRRKKLKFKVNCYTKPLFHDGLFYFGSRRNGLVCFDSERFDIAWTAPVEDALLNLLGYEYPPLRSLSSCPVLWKGLIWATCQDGALYAWDPKTGERRERIFTGVPYVASATVADGDLFAADFTGNVRRFA